MIGLLNAYHHQKNAEPYQLEYGPMFLRALERSHPGEQVRVYGVAFGELPQSVFECDSWIIGGSPKSVYESDDWIKALGAFVQAIDREKRKLVGVCFGHQLVAHFLGGRTEKSRRGWGVGVRSFEVVKQRSWMQPSLKTCSLIYSHQDEVAILPRGAELLGRSEFCANEMYAIGDHIVCMQGHPEFTTGFAKGRLDARLKLVGRDVYDRAVASLALPTSAEDVGQWLHNFAVR